MWGPTKKLENMARLTAPLIDNRPPVTSKKPDWRQRCIARLGNLLAAC